jgi:hypothetical protein
LIRIIHCKRHSAGSTVTSAGGAVLTFVALAAWVQAALETCQAIWTVIDLKQIS